MDMSKIQELLDESSAKVEGIMKDTAALENILQSAEKKLNEIPGIGQYAAKLPLMLSMIRSYISKEYTDVSTKVVVSMVGALVYMLKGKDLINDKIPVIGVVDDLAVLGLALQLNDAELAAYAKWREEKDAPERTVEPEAVVEEETSETE
ncbi:MAG: DUF1232 domain-containing protein [Erysipelotrichaceae bacterium]|nr:DUF1232 domain-containing protein [Erysipelotrichaceae bacterium]